MGDANDILSGLLGIILIIVVMLLAYALLKPHQVHKRRLWSSLLLKVSYLVFLFTLLFSVYLAVVFKGGLKSVFHGFEYYLLMISAIVSTVGILIRRGELFRKHRDSYNFSFTGANIVFIIVVFLMFFI